MKFLFWDFSKRSAAHPLSDNMAIDSDGDILKRMSANLSMNLDSGEVHNTSCWDRDDDRENSRSTWNSYDEEDSYRSSWDSRDDDDSYRSSWDSRDDDDSYRSSWDRDDDY